MLLLINLSKKKKEKKTQEAVSNNVEITVTK